MSFGTLRGYPAGDSLFANRREFAGTEHVSPTKLATGCVERSANRLHTLTRPTHGAEFMGLIAFLKRLFLGTPPSVPEADDDRDREPAEVDHSPAIGDAGPARPSRKFRRAGPLHFRPVARTEPNWPITAQAPYRFARSTLAGAGFTDLTLDHDHARLEWCGLPDLRTPEDLARWLEIPLGQLAWLAGRFFENQRPQSEAEAHYHFHWVRKKSGGYRLIEAPKVLLKQVQTQILRGILDKVPAHPNAHGFVKGRSIRSNALPHVRKAWVLKIDLQNFYPSVSYSRVVAIFRALGYCREISLWLGRLTTSTIPSNLGSPDGRMGTVWEYRNRHLPQGAPTSPALANLSAFSLDVRLKGMANRYEVDYTRYADDLTFSGQGRSIPALREIIPFVRLIVSSERFTINRKKQRVLRRHQQQTVTGLVINQKLSLSRAEFDTLKAILTNCIRQGPASQNRDGHDDFASHLRGRIGHWMSVNLDRGQKLLELYQRIDWSR